MLGRVNIRSHSPTLSSPLRSLKSRRVARVTRRLPATPTQRRNMSWLPNLFWTANDVKPEDEPVVAKNSGPSNVPVKAKSEVLKELVDSQPKGPRSNPALKSKPVVAQGAPKDSGLANTKYIVAVASGKGGVGKSTVATNIAVALAKNGERVGLLDADIYGPSIPTMMNLNYAPVSKSGMKEKIIPPNVNYNVKCISMGMLAGKNQAAMWRGPMAMQAVDQLLYGVDWGKLDVLVIDMPPGTGDVHISLVQRAPINGAIIVTTPQEVALSDVRRGIDLFDRTAVPNMSYLKCDCGTEHRVFGPQTGEQTALHLGLDLLAELPLDPKVAESSDKGTPIAVSDPSSLVGATYMGLAKRIMFKLDMLNTAPPEIALE